jgi:hypothetical protein
MAVENDKPTILKVIKFVHILGLSKDLGSLSD